MKVKHSLLLLLGSLAFLSLARGERYLYEEDDDSYYEKQSTNTGAKVEKKFPPVSPFLNDYFAVGSRSFKP